MENEEIKKSNPWLAPNRDNLSKILNPFNVCPTENSEMTESEERLMTTDPDEGRCSSLSSDSIANSSNLCSSEEGSV